MSDFIQIRNWRKYQHYKDRCPPWIMVHANLLDKPKWRGLSDASKGQLAAIWLLASRLHKDPTTDAVIPNDPKLLSALTGCKITHGVIANLMNKRFLNLCKQDASGVLAMCSPETETETETETYSCPNGFGRFWDHYPKRVGKRDALKAWKQTLKDRPSDDDLIAKVDELSMSRQWLKESGQYVPLPATWLRRGGWEDEVR